MQRQVEKQEAEMEKLQDQREAKEDAKDLEAARLYAEDGELVPDALKETADDLVEKVAGKELKFELDEADKDQLDIIEVRHQAEMEKAMKAAEVEIE